MQKTGNRTAITWVALLLALLFLLPAPNALAREAESSSALSSEDSQEESSLLESSSSSESQPEASDAESQLSSQEESDPQPTPAPEEESSSQPEEESSQLENTSLEEAEEETLAAYPLLKTGGHEAYMSGEAGARFYPDRAMTRAEMAQVLYNSLASYPPVEQSYFDDVPSGSWYAAAVNTLAQLGVLSGYGDGTFRPTEPVSRAEFVAAVCKCFDNLTAGDTSRFSDVAGHWAVEYIGQATAAGWISGYTDGTFQPDGNILRCQVASIMNYALERTGDGFAADANTQEFVDVPTSHWAFEHIAEAADPVYDDPTATITGNEVRVRSGPGTTYTILGEVNTGDLVYVLADPSGDWVQVRTMSGIVGYVSSRYVQIDEEEPSDDPSGFQVGQTVQVTAEPFLRLRAQANTTSTILAELSTGVLLTVTSVESNGWLGVRTSGGDTGYVSGEYVVVYDPNNGTATGATLSATSLTLSQYQSIRLDGSVTSNLSAMRWESSNEAVVSTGYTVSYGGNSQGAMLYGVAPGTATITFTDGTGTTKATCTVTVTAPEAVRFAYGEGNIVAAGESFDLVAVTDTGKTSVQFEIVDGPASGKYVADTVVTENHTSSYGLPANTVKVFSSTVKFGTPGTYTVKATSQTSGGSWSTDSYEFTVAVTSSNGSATTASDDERQPSGEIIDVLADFEASGGYIAEIEDDLLSRGNPTIGYGYVVQQNVAFYNNMTETEAYAQLVDTANSSRFGGAVENFRQRYGIKMSQAQFDALTSFVYNHGAGVLNPSWGYCRVLLNAADPTSISSSNTATGTVTVTDIDTPDPENAGETAAPVFTSTDINSEQVMVLPSGARVTIDGYRVQTRTVTYWDGSTATIGDRVWYHVIYNSRVGWIPAGYITLDNSGGCDLTYVDSTVLANNFLQWNSGMISGLIYRRIAECNIFFFGDYDRAMKDKGYWGENTYGYHFPENISQYDSTQN